MKVALVSDFYAPRIGGLELQMRDLGRELSARGHEVVVMTATPGSPELDGIPVRRIEGPLLPGLRVIWRKRSVAALERAITDEKFDVIHCHTAFSPLSLAAAFVARKHGIASVLTEHSVLKGFGGALLAAGDRLFHWSRWPGVLSAVSTYVADEMRRVTGGREVLVLPNGVRPEEWSLPHAPTKGERRPLEITSVMRLYKRKRPIEVVRAIARVHARLPPDKRPRFTLVGDGPERKRVEREAERLGVRQYLELTGWQPRAEVQKVLARSSVFILPTSKEALSIATLEALSAGLPTVAMSHGGVGDIIEHGREGFLAADSDQFIDYIVRLVEDDALRARLGGNARAAAARFSWQSVIARHLELYELARQRVGRDHDARVTIPPAAA